MPEIKYAHALSVDEYLSTENIETINALLKERLPGFFRQTGNRKWTSKEIKDPDKLNELDEMIALFAVSGKFPKAQFVLTRIATNGKKPEKPLYTFENGLWYDGAPKMRPYAVVIDKRFVLGIELLDPDAADEETDTNATRNPPCTLADPQPVFVDIYEAKSPMMAIRLASWKTGHDPRILSAKPIRSM